MRGVASAILRDASDTVILDMEASIEHLGRGTPQGADTLLVVVEPYYRALETAGRVAALARELGTPRIVAVANKTRDEEDRRVIAAYLSAKGIPLAADIPFDPAVTAADRRGIPVIDAASDAVRAVERLWGGI